MIGVACIVIRPAQYVLRHAAEMPINVPAECDFKGVSSLLTDRLNLAINGIAGVRRRCICRRGWRIEIERTEEVKPPRPLVRYNHRGRFQYFSLDSKTIRTGLRNKHIWRKADDVQGNVVCEAIGECVRVAGVI